MPLVARDRRRRPLRRDSVPLAIHGLLEYGLGVLLIASDSLVSFDEEGARVASILIGVAVLSITALSDIPTALLRRIPLSSHILLDYVFGIVLIVSPFLLGFRDDLESLVFFVVMGVAYLSLAVATRFDRPDRS